MVEFLRILTCAAGEISFFYGGVFRKFEDFLQILKGFPRFGKFYGGVWDFPLNFMGEFLWILNPQRRRKIFFYGGVFMDFGPSIFINFMGRGATFENLGFNSLGQFGTVWDMLYLFRRV